MTDDARDKRPSRRRASPEAAGTPAGPGRSRAAREWVEEAPDSSPGTDESLAALERLQSLAGEAAAGAPAVDEAPRSSRSTYVAGPLRRAFGPRSRPATTAGSGAKVARIVAPAVFLVAVVALVIIVFQAGIIGGSGEPLVTPSPKPTKVKSVGGKTLPAGTRSYRIKSGDTLSAVAVKFHTTISDIESLNPGMSTSTLVAGDRIIVPIP
jgi:hypothetical protein